MKAPLFSIDLPVRGYELDSLGHVNNAVFSNYLEHSRWEMFTQGALPPLPAGMQVVIRRMELDYQHELLLGDNIRVIQWPRKVGTTSVTLGASIYIIGATNPARVGQLALLATQVITCVRPLEGKVAVPENWRALMPQSDPGDNPFDARGERK